MGYSDAGWVGSLAPPNNVFIRDNLISWKIKMQIVVAKSNAKA